MNIFPVLWCRVGLSSVFRPFCERFCTSVKICMMACRLSKCPWVSLSLQGSVKFCGGSVKVYNISIGLLGFCKGSQSSPKVCESLQWSGWVCVVLQAEPKAT